MELIRRMFCRHEPEYLSEDATMHKGRRVMFCRCRKCGEALAYFV